MNEFEGFVKQNSQSESPSKKSVSALLTSSKFEVSVKLYQKNDVDYIKLSVFESRSNRFLTDFNIPIEEVCLLEIVESHIALK